jgi:hypothetical protein
MNINIQKVPGINLATVGTISVISEPGMFFPVIIALLMMMMT